MLDVILILACVIAVIFMLGFWGGYAFRDGRYRRYMHRQLLAGKIESHMRLTENQRRWG